MSIKIGKACIKLDKTLLVIMTLVLVAVAATYWKGQWELTISGLTHAGKIIQTIWLRLLLGCILGGLVKVLIPNALIAKWLGHASGLKGILIGSYIGTIMPPGPWVNMPIIASIYRAGAGVGPIIALLTGRAMLGLPLVFMWQIPFFGVKIPLARYIASVFIPPFVGLAGRAVSQILDRAHRTTSKSDHNTFNQGQVDGIGNAHGNPKNEKEAEEWT